MNILGYILIFTFLGSVVSMIGGIILLAREKFAYKISHLLSAFAAGTLLGAAFFDLLPEAHELKGDSEIFLWALVGVLLFFLVERFIRWFHHHHEHEKASAQLIVLGDSIHNFIDGVVIAATFLVSIPLGIVTSLAVAAHEIPQEIGDFGVLLHRKINKKRILILNFFSALASILGAVITYLAGDIIKVFLPALLSLSAGFFIYIAASDLIPEIHLEERKAVAMYETLLLFLGVLVIWVSVKFLG